jgi:hypothetical protein
LCRENVWIIKPALHCKLHGSMSCLNRFTGRGCKPVYAADTGNGLVVNDTSKRQNNLSGAGTGDERE